MKSVEVMRSSLLLALCVTVFFFVDVGSRDLPHPAQRGDIRIAVISDLNSSYGSIDYEPEVSAAIDLIINEWRADLVLCAGDMIAGQHLDLTEENLREMWAAFDSVVAEPLRSAGVAFGFTFGNHDGSGSGRFEQERQIAAAYWRNPANHPGTTITDSTHYPFYYAFTHDSLFVVSLDASHAGTVVDETQMTWLEATLASPEARKAAFRMAIGHLPALPVASGRERPGEFLSRGDLFLEMLDRHAVDVYISGHHHAFYLARHGNVDLLYAGLLGQGQRVLLGEDEPVGQTLTLMDVTYDPAGITYTTYRIEVRDGETVLQEVSLEALPEEIPSGAGVVTRRDLVLQP